MRIQEMEREGFSANISGLGGLDGGYLVSASKDTRICVLEEHGWKVPYGLDML